MTAPDVATDHMDLIELYGAKNAIEADRIGLILDDNDVEHAIRATTSPSFPTSSSHLVLVRDADRERARAAIEGARTDGVISSDGTFL